MVLFEKRPRTLVFSTSMWLMRLIPALLAAVWIEASPVARIPRMFVADAVPILAPTGLDVADTPSFTFVYHPPAPTEVPTVAQLVAKKATAATAKTRAKFFIVRIILTLYLCPKEWNSQRTAKRNCL